MILHVGLLIAVREALRWRPTFDGPVNRPMQLRLIDVDVLPTNSDSVRPPPRLAAPLNPLQREKRVSPTEIAASTGRAERSSAVKPMATQSLTPERAPSNPNRRQQPRLVGLDGRVFIPKVDAAIAAEAARFPVNPAAQKAGASNPFSHRSPLPYVATRFDSQWVPDGATLLGTFLRKLADKTVKKSSGQIAGLQIDCVWILVVANCSWGVPPRLSIDDLKKLRADVPLPRGLNTQPGS